MSFRGEKCIGANCTEVADWLTERGTPLCEKHHRIWHMHERNLLAEVEETAGHRALIRKTSPGSLRAIAARYGRKAS